MVNNYILIEKIKQQLKNTNKEQLEQALKLAEEEYNPIIELEYKNIYTVNDEYLVFPVHTKKTSGIEKIELEAA